ncbi:diguanylate cyclase [Paenibacillus chartarius]|uniref:Diguanylate cyclase n=1 Tax=Paenibacillus chartarius TaxID=747481 RepID=A0ABV6DLY6_9BACL
MMQAEWARLTGSGGRAETLYQKAVQLAGEGSFIRYKALSNELAGKYYRDKDYQDLALYYFRQAAYYYSVWGAKGKVRQLERDYGVHSAAAARIPAPVDGTISVTVESIDIRTIMMASQALSKEIGLGQLLNTLMEIVIVNAGAQRGCIRVMTGSGLVVEGEYEAEGDAIRVTKYDGNEYDFYPKSMFDAAAEKQETVILDDAESDHPYRHDPYLLQYRPKSVLCMPLMNQNKVTAIIYLENNLVSGAFTKERLQTIDLLSREMVYSLENASLYSDLERSEEKYRELVGHLMDGIVIVQNDRFVFVNEAMADMVGSTVDLLTGDRFERYVHHEDLPIARQYHKGLLNGEGEFAEYEIRLTHPEISREIIAIFKAAVIQYSERPAILGTVKDITERKRAEEELRTHRFRLEELVAERTEQLEDKNEQLNKYIDIVDKHVMIMHTDTAGQITSVSEEFCRISGYTKEELAGRNHGFLVPAGPASSSTRLWELQAAADTVWKGELVQITKDGSTLWLDITVEPVKDQGRIAGYAFIGHNITDKKRIEQLSITDELTGLYNRRHFSDVFGREVDRASAAGEPLSLFLLDIDYYKKYNDTYGHFEGDTVLRKLGAVIREQLVGTGCTAFRLGGEEFGVLCAGLDAQQSYELAHKIRASVEALCIPHRCSATSEFVTVSLGIAVAAASGSEETIYKSADKALYTSKRKGRNCVTIYIG